MKLEVYDADKKDHPMINNAAVTRIAHDLCVLLDDDWTEGHKLYQAQARIIYDREIHVMQNFLLLITNEIMDVTQTPLSHVSFIRLRALAEKAKVHLKRLKEGRPLMVTTL